MNPRQRRAILLIGLSFLGLVGVFVLVAGYVSDVRTEVGPKIKLLALSEDAVPYQPITDDMVTEVVMPEKWAPRTAIKDAGELVGLVATTKLSRSSILQDGMLSQPPQLQSGQREVAILVDAETGVAGKIAPGDKVDIIATFPGSEDGKYRARSRNVVPGATIIDVGRPSVKGGKVPESADPQQVVPITFALTREEILRVTFAETNAQEVRLGLQRPDEVEDKPEGKEKLYEPRKP